MIVSRKHPLAIVLTVVALLVIAGCAGQMQRSGTDTRPTMANSAQRAIVDRDYARAAELYMQDAANASSRDRARQLRLEAGLAAAQAGDATMAQQILNSFTPSTLDGVDRGRYELARREISIANLPPDQALERLPPPSSGSAPEIAERVWEKRAQLQFERNNVIAGIGALVQRGVWLMDDRCCAATTARSTTRR